MFPNSVGTVAYLFGWVPSIYVLLFNKNFSFLYISEYISFWQEGRGLGAVNFTSSQSFIITFYIRWLDNFGNLYWIIFDWLVHLVLYPNVSTINYQVEPGQGEEGAS